VWRTLSWLWALDTRALEMTIGMAVASRGLWLFLSPSAMDSSIYDGFKMMMPAYMWGLLCVIAGAFQMGGVLINGHWSKSPWMRFTGAMMATTFFAMISTLYFNSVPPESLSTSIYVPIVIANLWTALNIATKS
jgi:hypothetical protein